MRFTINKFTDLKRLLSIMGRSDDTDTLQLLVELVGDAEYYGTTMSTPIWDTPFTITAVPTRV